MFTIYKGFTGFRFETKHFIGNCSFTKPRYFSIWRKIKHSSGFDYIPVIDLDKRY